MNRVVSLSLMLLLLVSQSLCAVAHSHVGTSAAEPADHSVYPHIHLHGAQHHHGCRRHGHHSPVGNDSGANLPSADSSHFPCHDWDAIYGGEIEFLQNGRVTDLAKSEVSSLSFVCGELLPLCVSSFCSRDPSQQSQHSKCARYLQLLSIRC